MKMCILLLGLLAVLSCSDSKKPQRDADGMILKNGQFYDSQEEETNMVYICTGKSSHAYHSTKDCYGIEACKGDIEIISLDDAIEMGRTPCHYCHEEQKTPAGYDPDKYDSVEQYLEERSENLKD